MVGGGGAGRQEQETERNFQGQLLFPTQEFVLSDITKVNLWITAPATRTAGKENNKEIQLKTL